jgi:hypothetical protein
VADRVRVALSQPISATGKEHLQRQVTDSIQEVDRIVAHHGVKVDSLPAPTRRAYQFLKSVDFDTVTPQVSCDAELPARGNITLRGLKSFWEGVLDGLARPAVEGMGGGLYRRVRLASEDIEQHLETEGMRIGDLTRQSRAIWGWLRFFSHRENFDTYRAAMRRACPHFEATIRATGRLRPPAFVHFRPVRGLYRIRTYGNGTRVTLPTPMICFSEELFASLATAMFDGGSKQAVTEACSSGEFQTVQAELEALSGAMERTAGVHRDLAVSFERVCKKYFGGTLSRPRLTWSRAFTGRKFGHYSPIEDTVMISSSLDQGNVQELVLDFIMYHELLHKKLGVGWQNGRRAVHTPEFRAEEKRFEQYAMAEAALEKLASRHA